MKFLKKISVSLAVATFLCSPISVFANGILPEDKEAICTAMEKVTENRQLGYCQFIYSSPLGKPLLKESIAYALDLKKYRLAERLINVFAKFYDINEVENLDYMVASTGKMGLYKKLINLGYEPSTPSNSTKDDNLLNAAIKSENLKFVSKFLDEGFDPNSKDFSCIERYPLHICLTKIIGIAEDPHHGNGLGEGYGLARIINLVEMIRLLCEKGANPFLCSGKNGDTSACDLLEKLNPENEKNCYSKLKFKSKGLIDFSVILYEALKNYIYKSEFSQNTELTKITDTHRK